MTSSVKVHKRDVPIDPTLLFQRISLIKKNDEQLEDFFKHELAPYPLSLFNEEGMRKNVKSEFYKFFIPLGKIPTVNDPLYVVDGGFILRKVVWKKDASYYEIFQAIILYITRHYSSNLYIIFDGYEDDNSIKNPERLRRLNNNFSTKVEIKDIHTIPPLSQNTFLLHSMNKTQFIKLLCDELSISVIKNKVCRDDADAVIVSEAIREATSTHKEVIIVGEDIDLLVILTHLASKIEKNIFFFKPEKGKKEKLYYTQKCFKSLEFSRYILFVHAFSGCDTTSAFFGIGKTKLYDILHKHPTVLKSIDIFYDAHAPRVLLFTAGQSIIKALYGFHPDLDIDFGVLRFKCFVKNTNSTSCKLSSLPPTKEAADQHSLRVYYQIQNWVCNTTIQPENYGWKKTPEGLLPVPIPQGVPILPESLLEAISCKCKGGCKTKACSCRKVGISCTVLCKYCNGKDRTNIPDIDTVEEYELADTVVKMQK